LLPTVGSPADAAMPSSSVLFPDPFSPTKNVTAVSNESSGIVRTAGTLKGNALDVCLRMVTERRWAIFNI
jgi:hypothetical protein